MKGYELIQKIATGEIKQGAVITEYKNGKFNEIYILKGTIQENSTGYEMYNNHLYEEEYTYTIKNPLEENKEIEELNYYTVISIVDGKIDENVDKELQKITNKINELVRAVNKLIKEREEK